MQASYKAIIVLTVTLLLQATSVGATEVTQLTPSETVQIIQTVNDLVILDIRTPDEVRSGFLNGAHNIDFYGRDFKTKLNSLDKATPYLIYCRSGRRSGITIEYLQKAGFKQIYHLKNGINAWKSKGFPVMR